MEYKLSELARMVRVVMDRDMTSAALGGLGDVDTLGVDDIIRASIPRAVRLALLSAPLYLIDTGTDGTDAAKGGISMSAQGDGYVGRFRLPDDFLRLVGVRMKSWKRNARGITEDDAEYQRQLSEYAGIRGNASNPVAAVVQGADGLYMELYSSASEGDTLEWFRYIAMPAIGGGADVDGGVIALPERLADATVYLAASLAFESLGAREQGDALAKTALAMAGTGAG